MFVTKRKAFVILIYLESAQFSIKIFSYTEAFQFHRINKWCTPLFQTDRGRRKRLKDIDSKYFALRDKTTRSLFASKESRVFGQDVNVSFTPEHAYTPFPDPKDIEIVQRCDTLNHETQEECYVMPDHSRTIYPFVNMIRSSADYIANHRNTLAVYHIPGELLEWKGFSCLIDDIALTWLLGMKIVIVIGCRKQIDGRLAKENDKVRNDNQNFLRVTNLEMMRIVQEEAGFVRFEVERQLNRCLKFRGGADLRVHGALNGNVVSGNFYDAQSVGIMDGIDYGYTGFPTQVNKCKIEKVHEQNDIVLLTPCGKSSKGDQLNVDSESLTAHVAISLGASKIIYCSNESLVLRNKENGCKIQKFCLKDAKRILQYNSFHFHRQSFPSVGRQAESTTPQAKTMLNKIGWASLALENGVDRAHIIASFDGALLSELFTANYGCSTCIFQDETNEIHPDKKICS